MERRNENDFRRPIPRELEFRAQRDLDRRVDDVIPPLSPTLAELFGGVPNWIGRRN